MIAGGGKSEVAGVLEISYPPLDTQAPNQPEAGRVGLDAHHAAQPREESVPTYKAPVEDVLFLLHDVFRIGRYDNLPGFSDAAPDVLQAILGEAGKFCEQVLAPLNRTGDLEGCTRHGDGSVTTPKGFREAYKQYSDGGWMGISAPAEFGGQALPGTLTVIVNEMLVSANMSFAMYPALTQGAMAAILAHGSPDQKAAYLPRMVEGRWTGTMNLTEPHCGTDLGLIRSKAAKQADGSYRISGTKIFISAGEHDLAENIVHLVLARIEGAPAGTRGISLFIVPKFLPSADGSPGAKNAVSCGSIEEKMGIHANSTCVMNYDGATGFLIGPENRGLNAMFTMMNEARLGVGVQGLALSEVAYQNAAAYARDRAQGRALTGAKFPDKAADPIIVHPDVRRVLMTIRAFNEAARALYIWTALQADVARRSGDDRARQAADDHMGLLTPVIKGVLTDVGFANTVLAQQVYGGHGYIAEHGMEQFVRDARIAMIYEGTNGIQALDLVGRKLPKDRGRALQSFVGEIQAYLKAQGEIEAMKPYVVPLATASEHMQKATMWFIQNAMEQPDNAGVGAADFMHLFGLVALGYMWCRMAEAAHAKLANGGTEEGARMQAKLVTARFFMERMLPETAAHLARIRAGAASVMELPAEAF
jgi:alkylation response protein AidB-like acyl-CoA dehydrogenase